MIEDPKLPFELDALEPHMSKETLEYHYEKHHLGYVKNLNKVIKGTRFEDSKLEEIVEKAAGGFSRPIFNNAAQVWNHTFFWNCLSTEGGEPSDELKEAIDKQFKSMDKFKEKFKSIATKLFGSGWVWLVQTAGGVLTIEQFHNADSPLKRDVTPLLVLDVWEHAYYIDHRNDRGAHVDAFWNIVNWEFVNGNYGSSKD